MIPRFTSREVHVLPAAITFTLFIITLVCCGISTAEAAVQGSSHDMTRLTEEFFVGPCVYCHIPHQAKGERLWVSTPRGPKSGWGSRPVAQLCYSCHDNTGGGFNASDVTATAYSELSHGYRVSRIPSQPDGSPPDMSPLPYTETGMLDCTTCHDPHSDKPPFLRMESIDDLCKGCHERENPGLVGKENRFGLSELPYSLHPTDVEYLDIPGNGPTNLHPYPERLQVPTEAMDWKLGSHRVGWQQGSGKISCQTCHPVHGGWDYLLEVLPGPPAGDLLPLENRGGNDSAFCQMCHQGGYPEETVGEGTDHPINSNDGQPVTNFPGGWPAGDLGEVTCSSCHIAHGGEPGTSSLRKGGGSVDGWCFSCHTVINLIPPYHHSSRENDSSDIYTSVITCGDCHGRGRGWTAHNGFQGFKVEPLPDRSALCEACHRPENPLYLDEENYLAETGQTIDFTGAEFPSSHGLISGSDSHLVDEPDVDRIINCQVKTTAWETSGGYSRYGDNQEVICESCHSVLQNVGVSLGTNSETLLTGGWKTNLLLESYEDNSPGVGVEDPDFLPGPTLSGLCRGCHYSTRTGVAPSFVHNPEAHTVVDYTYPEETTPYGRATTSILTSPNDSNSGTCPEVSTADQKKAPSGLGGGTAPGAFSYPVPNKLDCDSCHRPHGAHSDSSDDGIHRLLEYTAPGAHGTAPCTECHDTESQCGYGGGFDD